MARFSTGVLLVLLAMVVWAQDKPASGSKPAAHPKSSAPDSGAISNGAYRNSSFGFSYRLPYGWVDRTSEMQEGSPDTSSSRLLLAVFERPPEATGDSVNSAVVIAAEPLPNGMKTAAEYFESLSALAIGKGFEAKGGPGEFSVGATRLVRGDFSKPRGTLTMFQTSLVTLEKGYAVSFTFIGGSADEVNELIERLNFAARKSTQSKDPYKHLCSEVQWDLDLLKTAHAHRFVAVVGVLRLRIRVRKRTPMLRSG